MTLRDTVNGAIQRWRDSTDLDERINKFVQPAVQQFKAMPQQAMQFAQNPSVRFSAPQQVVQPLQQASQFVQQGTQRVSNAIKTDPGQFWLGRSYASIVPDSKVVFAPLGKQTAEDIGFGLQGAAKLNPISWTNYGLDKPGTQIAQQNAPQTSRQQNAQDIGEAIYGTALTAPIGAGGSLPRMAANVASRVVQGGALGVGMNAASTLATQHRLPTQQEVGKAALGGVENSWKLAITNAVTDKALGAIGLGNLQTEQLGNAWKIAGAAKDAGLKATPELVKQAVYSTLLRGLSEVPAENGLFTALDKLNGKEKETYINAFMRNLPGNILGNMIFAGGSATLQGTEIMTRDQRKAVGQAAVNAFKQLKQGYQDAQAQDAINYKELTGQDLPPGASGGFIAGRKAPGFDQAQKEDKTFTGVDNQQKFEVSDINAKLLNPSEAVQAQDGTYRLGDVLDHKELYQQYPDLQDMRVKFSTEKKTLGGDALGGYNPQSNTIDIVVAGSSDTTKQTLLHEIQHAIQTKEGFASGGNLNTAMDNTFKNPSDASDMNDAIKRYFDSDHGQEVSQRIDQLVSNKLSADDIEKTILKEYPDYKQVVDYTNELQRINKLPATAFEAYHRLAGETEARGVESRIGLDQRTIDISRNYAKSNPGSMYDIAPEDQIVRFDKTAEVNNEPTVKFDQTLRQGQPPVSDRTYNNQDITARERFNIPELQKLSGGGSDRDVYDLGNGTVLKVAKSARGLAQNDVEGEPYAPVPSVQEKGKNYVVVDKVNPPDSATKQMVGELKKLNIWDLNNDRSPTHYDEVNKAIEILDKYGVDGSSVGNYNVMWGDLSSIRNWGTDANGTPVHLDAGTFGSQILKQYEGVKNLDNPDFRDVYNQSRAAKKSFGDTDPNTMYSIKKDQTPSEPLDPFIQELDAARKEGRTPLENQLTDVTGQDVRLGRGVDPSRVLTKEDLAQKAGESYMYDPEMTGQGGFNQFKGMLSKFIGERDAAKTTATQIAEPFAKIPVDQGWEVINYLENPSKYQDASPEVKQWASQLSDQYDQLYKQAQDSGMDMNFVENYKPHIWEEPPAEVARVFMSARGDFKNAKERVIPTYEEGIALGLHPKYDHPALVLEAYVNNLQKAISARNFMQTLQDNNVIVPASVARENPGFVPITAPGMQKESSYVMTNDGNKEVIGNWYAPEPVAKLINQVFSPQDGNVTLGRLAKISKGIQEVTLSGGVPGTPINAFGVANLQKEVLSGNVVSPIKAFFRSMSQGSSNEYFSENSDVIKMMQQENLPVRSGYSVESMIDRGTVQNVLGRDGGEAWQKLMEDGTFKRFMPMLSIDMFKDVYQKAVENGSDTGEAQKIAGDAVKSWSGAITTDQMATRNIDVQNLKSTFLFAPTFRESMINFWTNNLKALAHPLAQESRKNIQFLIGAAITYAGMDLANRHFNGHSMMENPEGKQDKLLIPLGNGTTIGVPFLSSIATVPRGLIRTGQYLLKGDVNKAAADTYQTFASQMIKAPGDIALNQDYFGNEIYDKNAQPLEKYAQMGQYTAKSLMHPWAREALNAGEAALPISDENKKKLGIKTEQQPLYQTISQASEMPLRFYKSNSIESAPFWDQYFKLKDKATYYDELSYKDKPAALDYLNKNRADLIEFKRMRGLVGATNGGQDTQALKDYMGNGNVVFAADGQTAPVANTPENRDFIKERLKLGDKVSNDELITAYLGNATDLPTTNRYETGMRSKALYGKLSDIDSNEVLTPDQKNTLYSAVGQQLGITPEDMSYYRIARQDIDLKTMHVYDEVQQGNLDHGGLVKYLIDGRRKVNGEVLAADGVLKNLYDDGMLSKAEYNQIRAIKQLANGTVGRAKTGGGSKATPKFTNPGAVRFTANTPKFSVTAPKISSPSMAKVRIAKTAPKSRYVLPTRKQGAILRIATNR